MRGYCEKFPEVAARLKGYLAAGQLELIGGTYGQPMGTTDQRRIQHPPDRLGPRGDPQGLGL